MTLATLFSRTATQELVVPRSMPMIWAEVLRTEKKDFRREASIIYNYGLILFD